MAEYAFKRAEFLHSALIATGAIACSGVAFAQAAPTAVVRIGTAGNDGNAMAFYAQDIGIFARHGLESKIQVIRAGSGSGIAAAMTGGAIDIGEADIIAIAAAREHGIPLVLLAPSFLHKSPTTVTGLIVAKTSPIQKAVDLNDKVVAVPSLSGPAKVATMKWLEKNGADVKTIKFVEMPQITMAAAVGRGTVAAAGTTEPNLTAAENDTRVIASVYDGFGSVAQITAWFATEAWVKSNPDTAKRFIAAMRETAVWANKPENHPASAAILEKYTPFPPNVLSRIHRATYGESFDPANMQPGLDAAFEQKSLHRRAIAKEMLSNLAPVAK